MNKLEAIMSKINKLKDQLNHLAEEHGELSNYEILHTSEELDELINHYNKAKNEISMEINTKSSTESR